MGALRLIEKRQIECQLAGIVEIDLQQVSHLHNLKEGNGKSTTQVVMKKPGQSYFIGGRDMFQVADEWGVTLGPCGPNASN